MKKSLIIALLTVIICCRSYLMPSFFKTSHFFEFNMYPYSLQIDSYELVYDEYVISLTSDEISKHIIGMNLYQSDRWSINDELNRRFIYHYVKKRNIKLPSELRIKYLINKHKKIHVTKINL